MDQYRNGELVFDVIDDGPADGPVVLLLHGFPLFNTSWNAVIGRLTAEGHRCLAPNQRGYSRGARPTRRRDSRLQELVEDVLALVDTSGAQRVHLVGYDWGATVAWAVADEIPERLFSDNNVDTTPGRVSKGDGDKSAVPRVLVHPLLSTASCSGVVLRQT